ncbi:MAG TPA: hypothetical protein VIC27_02085, partial [Ktedonobacterales bacterium]
GPLAALCLLLALAVKLSRRVDDDINAYRLSTVFLVVGATLYYFPQVFAVEAASQVNLAGIAQTFTSNSNVTVALGIMWFSLAGVAVIGLYVFLRALTSVNRKTSASMPARTAPIRQTAHVA